MDLEQFMGTFQEERPRAEWSPLIQALWWDAKGNWDMAHDIADGSPLEHADWVHAYLHRKEGDEWNAAYWYRRAGRTKPNQTLQEEWQTIVQALL